MSKNLLFVLFSIALMVSCKSAKDDAEQNKKLFGRWYNKDYPLTFIDVEGSDYSEYMGEINSEMKGKIHWKDSLNFELEVTNVEGEIGKSSSMRPGKSFQVRIDNISPTQLRWTTNNKTTIFIRELKGGHSAN